MAANVFGLLEIRGLMALAGHLVLMILFAFWDRRGQGCIHPVKERWDNQGKTRGESESPVWSGSTRALAGPERIGLDREILPAGRGRDLARGQLARLLSARPCHWAVVVTASDQRLCRHPRNSRVLGTAAGVVSSTWEEALWWAFALAIMLALTGLGVLCRGAIRWLQSG